MEQPAIAAEPVSANYRYIAAYNEVNARIAQRQQSLTLYITLVVGLIAALLAASRIEGQQHFPIEWVLCGFPVASACLTLLNFKYEQTLTNLRQYLSELEQINNFDLHLPGYNTESRWTIAANKGRRFHDYACAVLIAACNSIALGIFQQIQKQNGFSAWIVCITVMVTLVSIASHLLITQFSYQLNKKRVHYCVKS